MGGARHVFSDRVSRRTVVVLGEKNSQTHPRGQKNTQALLSYRWTNN